MRERLNAKVVTFDSMREASASLVAMFELSRVWLGSIGGFMNLGVAKILFESQHSVYLAALAGIFVGAIWNYAVTSLMTWGRSGT